MMSSFGKFNGSLLDFTAIDYFCFKQYSGSINSYMVKCVCQRENLNWLYSQVRDVIAVDVPFNIVPC